MRYSNDYLIENGLIFKTITGSNAYGTNREGSDLDTRGIFIAPPEVIISPFEAIEQIRYDDKDEVIYEITKFLNLLIVQNPNILELLWVREDFIQFSSPLYEELRSYREELLTKATKFTFSEYAYSQLNRIKGHNKWINNPQSDKPPVGKDFLSVMFSKENTTNINYNDYEAYLVGDHVYALFKKDNPKSTLINRIGNINNQLPKYGKKDYPDILVKYNFHEHEIKAKNWKDYWTWKNNRNEARSALEEQHGYDTKHAMHLIRLLRMGKEILQDGVVNVYREDRKDLLDIRNGKYSYEEIIEMAEKIKSDMDTLYTTTTLKENVNKDFITDLLVDIYKKHWNLSFSNNLKIKI